MISIYKLFKKFLYPAFEEGGVYCFANVCVGQSVDQTVSDQ